MICRGAVANMLVTSCKDNICRIWAETVLPDDGLIDAHQLDAVGSQSAQLLSTQQHKKRFLQRLHHIRSYRQPQYSALGFVSLGPFHSA